MSENASVIETLPATVNGATPLAGAVRRPLVVGVAAALLYAGAGLVTGGTLWAFWNSVDMAGFAGAAWLNGVVPTEPGSLVRVAMVTGLFVIMLAVDAAVLIAGFHAWAGYGWSRWAGIVAVVVSLLALMINPVAASAIAPIALGAALLWLPSARTWFRAQDARRHPEPSPIVPATNVHYGPLPRYR